MSRNASGTYTLPAGNPVVTATVIASTWANTTLDDLKTEMTDSLSRSAKGGMLAQLGLVDGTAAAPALAFNVELSTGLYRPSANQLGLAVAGVGRLTLRTVSAAFGHTSPLAAGDTGQDVLLDTTATRTAGNLFEVRNGGASRLRLTTANLQLESTGVQLATPATSYIQATGTDAALTLRGNRAAGSGTSDLILHSAVTRTAGALLAIENNGSTRALVLFDGTVNLASAGSTNLQIIPSPGPVIQGIATDSTLTVKGNKAAGSTAAADLVLTSTATRTAGLLLDVQNNGTTKASFSFEGALSMAVSPAATATGYQGLLTKKNLITAWAKLSLGAAGAVTVTDGFNVASASYSGTSLTVTFASALANANYALMPCKVNDGLLADVVYGSGLTTSTFTLLQSNGNSTAVNWASGQVVMATVVGGV